MSSGMEKGRPARARLRLAGVLALALLIIVCGRCGAQAMEGFRWTDLHGEAGRVTAVVKALEGQKFTALREIAVVGDEALVVTTTRPNATARPDQDRFSVYSAELKIGAGKPVLLMTGSHLLFRDWLRFIRDGETELVATYDDCSDCRATTFLTAFYVDGKTKKWRVRWPRDVAGAPLVSASQGNPDQADQAYALIVGEDGRAVLATWSHFLKEDYLFAYDVDRVSGLERARQVFGSEAGQLKTQICGAGGGVLGIAAGQDSASCALVLRKAAPRAQRRSSRRHRVFNKPLVGESTPSNPHR